MDFSIGMSRWTGRVALVTGASGGIGLSICEQLVRYGMIVIGCGRNIEPIKKLADENESGKVHPYQCDLRNEKEIDRMFQWIKENFGGVDVLVNSAGLSKSMTLLESNAEDIREMLDINIMALILCSSKAIKSMLERNVNDGHIFNINSMSGHRLVGILNFYAATKFAVTAITEGFRRELAENTRIKITQISPGLVETEFLSKTFGAQMAQDIFARVKGNQGIIQAEDIANTLMFILASPEYVQIHDVLMRPTGEKL